MGTIKTTNQNGGLGAGFFVADDLGLILRDKPAKLFSAYAPIESRESRVINLWKCSGVHSHPYSDVGPAKRKWEKCEKQEYTLRNFNEFGACLMSDDKSRLLKLYSGNIFKAKKIRWYHKRGEKRGRGSGSDNL